MGHIAVRPRRTVHTARADKLFKRLTAARLDNTLDYEYRRLTDGTGAWRAPTGISHICLVQAQDRTRVTLTCHWRRAGPGSPAGGTAVPSRGPCSLSTCSVE